MLTIAATVSAVAQLTVTVTPGYTFSPGEAPTTTKLNQLGLPVATISGTIAGSAALAPNSVTGNLLKDSVVDGITLGFNASNPRQLEVTNGGISAAQINTNLDGPGIAGGWNGAAGIPLFVDYHSVINTNEFAVDGSGNLILAGKSNAVPGGNGAQLPCVSPISTAGSQLAITNFTFTSGPVSGLGTGLAINQAHGMTNGTPRMVRWVLVCTSIGGDVGYAQNQEVDINAFWSGSFSTAFSGGANTTNVFLSINNAGVGFGVVNGTTGATATITQASWEAKVYAWQ